MLLPGFTFVPIGGWICGVVILRTPWGKPVFKWLSLPIILSALYFPLFIFFNLDIIHHAAKSSILNGPSTQRVDRLVRQLAYVELIISNMLIRFIFLLKGRKLADFLCRLKFYSKSRAQADKNPLSVMDLVVTYLVFFCTIGIAVVYGVITYYDPLVESWLQQLGGLTHAIVYTLLCAFPLMIPAQCAFALILASLAYLSIIFNDYCKYVLYTLANKKTKAGVSIVASLERPRSAEKVASNTSLSSYHDQLFFTNQLRREVLARFEIVRDIFDLAHEIMSPMALVLLASSSISVVLRGYEVITFVGEKTTNVINNIGHVVNYVCYLWILQSAQRVQDTISARKNELADALVTLSDDANKLEKHAIRDVMNLLSVWNWEFTACEFFVIDRKLASGVLSLILTYVIVLVQLKFSDEPDINTLTNSTFHS